MTTRSIRDSKGKKMFESIFLSIEYDGVKWHDYFLDISLDDITRDRILAGWMMGTG